MKTFKELSIGDEIFFIKKNPEYLDYTDQYGNKYSNQIFQSHVISNLELDKAGNIGINYKINHYGNNSYLITIPKEMLSSNRMIVDKGDVWFSNKESAGEIARMVLLNAIEERKEIIRNQAKKAETEINQIRDKYFHILNPSLQLNS